MSVCTEIWVLWCLVMGKLMLCLMFTVKRKERLGRMWGLVGPYPGVNESNLPRSFSIVDDLTFVV